MKVLILAFVSIFLLGYIIYSQYRYQQKSVDQYYTVIDSVEMIEKKSKIIHEIQKERGKSFGCDQSAVAQCHEIKEQRLVTDHVIETLLVGSREKNLLESQLQEVRSQADHGNWENKLVFYHYTQIIVELIDDISFVDLLTQDAAIRIERNDCLRLIYAKECLGKIRALLYRATDKNVLPNAERDELIGLKILLHFHMELVAASNDSALSRRVREFLKRPQTVEIHALVDRAVQNGVVQARPEVWFAMSTRGIDSLHEIILQGFSDLQTNARQKITEIKSRFRHLSLLLGSISVFVLMLTMLIVLRILRPLKKIVDFVDSSIASGDVSNRLYLSSLNEFGVIATGINALLQLSENLIKEKEFLAFHDSLTGVYNRLRFHALFEGERQKSLRYGHVFSFVIFDIDHFKKVNDTFGHQVGDHVLQGLAALVANAIRANDLFARWGGEEFVLLLPETDAAGGVAFSEKIRRLIEAHAFPEVGKVTVSIGLTTFGPGDDLGSLCSRADQALYVSKAEGRNRVSLHREPGKT